jgi:hypothetical protein
MVVVIAAKPGLGAAREIVLKEKARGVGGGGLVDDRPEIGARVREEGARTRDRERIGGARRGADAEVPKLSSCETQAVS